MIKPQHRRIGFYPVSARDYLEPLQMLKGWVDHLIFCDIRWTPRNNRELSELRKAVKNNGLPEPSFFLGDALNAMDSLRPVDLFFLRRDSDGEGGSELNLLGPDKLSIALNLIKPSGLLVTDVKNGRDWFSDFMDGKIEILRAGNREIRLAEIQPWKEHELQAFRVV
ncbi:MAG: hypothetical protein ACSHX9_08000 [Luteolibacter sp.]